MKKYASIALRLIAAAIMLQTLYFKFTAAPESVYIFTEVGIEPWGRIGTGLAELVASCLLLVPRTIVLGATVSAGIMVGAIASHLFVLGIEVQGDGGQLFAYALTVLVASIVLLVVHSDQVHQYRKLILR
jgi:putative oxidoreductase